MGDAADDAMEFEEYLEDARSVLRQSCRQPDCSKCHWEPFDDAGPCVYKCRSCGEVCDPF